jgi:enoyl-CoA hydratase
MAYRTLIYSPEGEVAIVTLNRPPSNRVNLTMAQELGEVCRRLGEAPEVRVAVLTGKRRAFSAGLEVPRLGRRGDYSPEEWLRLHGAASAIARVEKVVIAAINGDALDQGLELALACDIRIASEGARLGLGHLSSGLIPWDGGSQRLPRLVGRGWALEMLITGRVLGAREALDIGLVSMVVPAERLLPTALEVARRIARNAPIALRYTKEAVHKGMDVPLEEGLRLEADLNILLYGTADRAEGVRSFLEKRQPTYRGE